MHADWRCDGYHWRQQGGKSHELADGVFGKKTPFYSKIGDGIFSPGFKREVYWDPRYPLRHLIHYIGDSSVQIDVLPHGNAKGEKKKKNFLTTKKSAREEMKTRPGLPTNVYKEMVCEAPEEAVAHAVSAPRNRKQVQNFQANERAKLRLSRDGLYNVWVMANEGNFVKHLEVSKEEVICIMYLDQLAEKICALIDRKDLGPFQLQMDTTFKLLDGYVTIVVVRYLEFLEAPVLPLLMMIHERKLIATHDTFFQKMAKYFPQLVSQNLFL